MIICSCNVITDTRIRETIHMLISTEPDRMITPGVVYRAMGCAPDCRGCMPNFVDTVYSYLKELEQAGQYLPPAKTKRSSKTRKSSRTVLRNCQENEVTAVQ